MTAAQAGQLCDDLTSYLNKQVDSQNFCQAAAVAGTAQAAAQDQSLTDAQLQQGCAKAVSTICTGGSFGSPDGGATACGSTAGCTATVAQISSCATDTGTSLAQFERMFPTCSMVTRARLATVNADASPQEAASCVPLGTLCPTWGPMSTMTSGG